MSQANLYTPRPAQSVPFLRTLRGMLFLIWSQAKGRSLFKAYVLPFVGVFAVSFLLALEPTRESFEAWLIDLFLLTALPLIALSISGGLLRDEIKDSTLEYLWTRPASRFRLLFGFYCGAVLKTFFYGCLFAVSIWLAGILKGSHPDGAMLPEFLGALLFSALTFCAGGLFLSTLTGKYMIWGIAYGAAIEMGMGRVSTNVSQLTIRHYIESIGQFGPDLSRTSVLSSLFVCIILALVLVSAAVLVFSTKSYGLGQEKEG